VQLFLGDDNVAEIEMGQAGEDGRAADVSGRKGTVGDVEHA